MTDDDVVPGGAGTVFRWLEELAADVPGMSLWQALDDNLRLVYAQQWLMGPGAPYLPSTEADRDALARDLSQEAGDHELFEPMFAAYVDRWRDVYAFLDGRPCLIGMQDFVGVDMEIVSVTSEEYVGEFNPGDAIPSNTFLTRLVGSDWRIAANARRLPVPGWPPTEEVIPGLRIDGAQD